MKLICHPVPGFDPVIRPAPLQRAWMDATPDRFAYRCLPLNIANAHGWEVLCPADFSAYWDGKGTKEAIRIVSDAHPSLLPVSHFGAGVLTFHVNCLLRTEPGINLWVGGPPNAPKHGIYPLTGVIETDWAPYSFTMNWKFTRPRTRVKFKKGEPFCFFFPLNRDMVEAVEPVIVSLSADPEFAAQHEAWSKGRATFIEELPKEGSSARAEGWQKAYFRGKLPDGTPAPAEHRTKLALKPFRPADGTGSGE
ncbi:DUF6065 family protein [Indioceanicola profundi]|uniref:DUF6065 family protein n=1 Tax=Indioceanicola profundi TaxID=2220096 RepID=UPI000E6ABE4D|nr:DUF6065 family protein [Indioceanicola profundi]